MTAETKKPKHDEPTDHETTVHEVNKSQMEVICNDSSSTKTTERKVSESDTDESFCDDENTENETTAMMEILINTYQGEGTKSQDELAKIEPILAANSDVRSNLAGSLGQEIVMSCNNGKTCHWMLRLLIQSFFNETDTTHRRGLSSTICRLIYHRYTQDTCSSLYPTKELIRRAQNQLIYICRELCWEDRDKMCTIFVKTARDEDKWFIIALRLAQSIHVNASTFRKDVVDLVGKNFLGHQSEITIRDVLLAEPLLNGLSWSEFDAGRMRTWVDSVVKVVFANHTEENESGILYLVDEGMKCCRGVDDDGLVEIGVARELFVRIMKSIPVRGTDVVLKRWMDEIKMKKVNLEKMYHIARGVGKDLSEDEDYLRHISTSYGKKCIEKFIEVLLMLHIKGENSDIKHKPNEKQPTDNGTVVLSNLCQIQDNKNDMVDGKYTSNDKQCISNENIALPMIHENQHNQKEELGDTKTTGAEISIDNNTPLLLNLCQNKNNKNGVVDGEHLSINEKFSINGQEVLPMFHNNRNNENGEKEPGDKHATEEGGTKDNDTLLLSNPCEIEDEQNDRVADKHISQEEQSGGCLTVAFSESHNNRDSTTDGTDMVNLEEHNSEEAKLSSSNGALNAWLVLRDQILLDKYRNNETPSEAKSHGKKMYKRKVRVQGIYDTSLPSPVCLFKTDHDSLSVSNVTRSTPSPSKPQNENSDGTVITLERTSEIELDVGNKSTKPLNERDLETGPLLPLIESSAVSKTKKQHWECPLRRIDMMVIFIFFIIVGSVICGMYFVGAKRSDISLGEDQQQNKNTNAQAMEDVILHISPGAKIETINFNPRHMALTWMRDKDRRHLNATDPTLIQRYIAALLYYSTHGNYWIKSDYWLSEKSECDWYGLTCDDNGNVWSMDLGSNNLTGTLLYEVISSIPHLRSLFLHNNSLNGTLPYLSELIPLRTSLTTVALELNKFTGTIPLDWGRHLNISNLYLNGNDLDGTLPDINFENKSFKRIDLSSNSIKGTLPASIDQLTNLKELHLHDNLISGSVPSSIPKLNVVELSLHFNRMTGTIPCQIFTANVTDLIISSDCLPAETVTNVKCDCCTFCCSPESQQCESNNAANSISDTMRGGSDSMRGGDGGFDVVKKRHRWGPDP